MSDRGQQLFRPIDTAGIGRRNFVVAGISVDGFNLLLRRLAHGDLLVFEGLTPPPRFEVVGMDGLTREIQLAVFHPSFEDVPPGDRAPRVQIDVKEHRVADGVLFLSTVASHAGGRKISGTINLPGEGAGSEGRLLVVLRLHDPKHGPSVDTFWSPSPVESPE